MPGRIRLEGGGTCGERRISQPPRGDVPANRLIRSSVAHVPELTPELLSIPAAGLPSFSKIRVVRDDGYCSWSTDNTLGERLGVEELLCRPPGETRRPGNGGDTQALCLEFLHSLVSLNPDCSSILFLPLCSGQF